MRLFASLPVCVSTLATLGLLGAAACSSTSTGGAGGGGGGPVAGMPDMHCAGMPAAPTSQADCHLMSDGGAPSADYGDTLYNAEGDDDDCKYHVAWSSSPIGENRDVTFTVTVTTKADSKPAGSGTGLHADADIIPEVFLSDTHPAPNTGPVATETTPGTYSVGPVRFDVPGQWTVRFHLYEQCSDVAEDSPHGDAAFYVQVP